MKSFYVSPLVDTFRLEQAQFICASGEGDMENYNQPDIWNYTEVF